MGRKKEAPNEEVFPVGVRKPMDMFGLKHPTKVLRVRIAELIGHFLKPPEFDAIFARINIPIDDNDKIYKSVEPNMQIRFRPYETIPFDEILERAKRSEREIGAPSGISLSRHEFERKTALLLSKLKLTLPAVFDDQEQSRMALRPIVLSPLREPLELLDDQEVQTVYVASLWQALMTLRTLYQSRVDPKTQMHRTFEIDEIFNPRFVTCDPELARRELSASGVRVVAPDIYAGCNFFVAELHALNEFDQAHFMPLGPLTAIRTFLQHPDDLLRGATPAINLFGARHRGGLFDLNPMEQESSTTARKYLYLKGHETKANFGISSEGACENCGNGLVIQ